MSLVCTQYKSTETWYSSKSFWISTQSDTENYTCRLETIKTIYNLHTNCK